MLFVHVTAMKTRMDQSHTYRHNHDKIGRANMHGESATEQNRRGYCRRITRVASWRVDLCCGGAPPACSVLMQWSFGAASVLLMLFASAREERLLLLFVRAREERAGEDGRGVEPNPAARLASAAANGRSSDRHLHRHAPAATIERECRAPLVGARAGLKGCAA